MPLLRPSVETIHNRIITGFESRLTGNTALLRRAVLRVIARVFAGSLHLIYGYLEFLADQLFVDKAETDWLERHGFMWGITRKAASFAVGEIILYGVDGTFVPEGTKVQNDNGVEYAINNDVTISGGYANNNVTAVEAGEAGNFEGTFLYVVTPIAGLDNDVVLVYPPGCTGGIDREDDETYRTRILTRIQTPPMGGSQQDYIVWATSDEIDETNGTVQNAWCFPTPSGPGTVDVVITAEGTSPIAPGALIADVQAYIDTVKPVTADVTVQTIDMKQVTFEISITPNTSDIQALITSNMEDLFLSVAAPGSNLLIAHIRDAVMNAGVDNYEITAIEVDSVPVSIDDIVFVDYEYPVMSGITYATLT